ncbi:unnamed protein product [Trifolium pratense]|uniref:Uncharacterized protein n=1 Tax=Trifolium pratense TaxID=57577 RepID=A0ACB0JNR9_TRIPR|nr:unnamed protein product [Trifolium pratense]
MLDYEIQHSSFSKHDKQKQIIVRDINILQTKKIGSIINGRNTTFKLRQLTTAAATVAIDTFCVSLFRASCNANSSDFPMLRQPQAWVQWRQIGMLTFSLPRRHLTGQPPICCTTCNTSSINNNAIFNRRSIQSDILGIM